MTTTARRHLRGCTPDSGVVHPECWCQAGKPWYAGKQPRRAVAERVLEALTGWHGADIWWRFSIEIPSERDAALSAIERAIGEADEPMTLERQQAYVNALTAKRPARRGGRGNAK